MLYSLTKSERFGWHYEIQPKTHKEQLHFFWSSDRKGFALTKDGADKKALRKIKRFEDSVERDTKQEWRES